jgi:hypothetical protein
MTSSVEVRTDSVVDGTSGTEKDADTRGPITGQDRFDASKVAHRSNGISCKQPEDRSQGCRHEGW